jgi:hypothetical protein
MNDLVKDATGIDFYSMRSDLAAARKAAQEAGIPGAGNACVRLEKPCILTPKKVFVQLLLF